MINFDVWVMLYGNASPDWVTRQLLLYLKLKHRRSKEPRLMVLAEVPPKPKAPLPIRLPDMITVPIDRVVKTLIAAFPL